MKISALIAFPCALVLVPAFAQPPSSITPDPQTPISAITRINTNGAVASVCQFNCPVGAEILFNRQNTGNGNSEVWSMALAGGSEVDLSATTYARANLPQTNCGNGFYTHSAAYIIFQCAINDYSILSKAQTTVGGGLNNELWRCAADFNSACAKIGPITNNAGQGLLQWRMSADGLKAFGMAITSWSGHSGIFGAGGVAEICNYSDMGGLSGCTSTPFPTGAVGWGEGATSDPTESPTCHLYFSALGTTTQLFQQYSIDSCAGTPANTWKQVTPQGVQWSEMGSFSPDGSKYAFTTSLNTGVAPYSTISGGVPFLDLALLNLTNGLAWPPITTVNQPGSSEYFRTNATHPNFTGVFGFSADGTKVIATMSDDLSYIYIYSLTINGAFTAPTISVTTPAANDAISGGALDNNYQMKVSLANAAQVTKVCYVVDSYPLYNPGIDAPTTLGCAIKAPWSVSYDSFWNLNGPHQVTATAYNASGFPVAVSAPVAFTTANSLTDLPGNVSPVNNNPTMTVATGTALTSNWSGAVTVTPTITGSPASTDSLTYSFFIDGILQAATTNSTGTATGTLYTTQFPDATKHNVCVEVTDNTTKTTYTGNLANNGAMAEWCRPVTFFNGATASQALLSASKIYGSIGGTYTITAQTLNTDGSLTAAPNPIAQILPLDGSGTVILGPGNSFKPTNMLTGVASVNATTDVVSFLANGAALVSMMTPTQTITDLAIDGTAGSTITSAAHPFTVNETGWLVNITGGTGCRVGVYQLSGANKLGNGFTPAGTLGSTNCTATTGPTAQAWVFVNPTNTNPCFGLDGSIQSSYTTNCFFPLSLFNGADILQHEQPYNTAIAPGASSGIAADLNASAFQTFEQGALPPALGNINGTEASTAWTNNMPAYLSNFENGYTTNGVSIPGILSYSRFRGILIGNGFATNSQNLWAMTYGNESLPNYISGTMTAMQYALGRYLSYNNLFLSSLVDEISANWGSDIWGVGAQMTPLGGPYTFSPSGTTQSGLISITALNSGTCTAKVSPNFFPVTFIGSAKFTIHGSVTSGMNSVAPATYSLLGPRNACANAASCGGGAVISGGGTVVTITIGNGGSNYYAPPVCKLVGGGGTYSTCTTTVNTATGQVTGATVTGASGYINAPSVIFTDSDFVFACSGVANGVYDSSNDAALVVDTYGDQWYASNTSVAYYDVWSRLLNQINSASTGKFQFSAPARGNSNPLSFATTSTNTLYPNAQSNNSVSTIATGNDLYWPTNAAATNFIASRLAAVGLLTTDYQGFWFPSLWGTYDPSKPTFQLIQGSTGYIGQQGYIPSGVTVVSCVGNTVTFSGPHGLKNIVPGITRIWVTGATDSGSPQNSCNNNFIVLSIPTPTTMTVALGATDFTGTGSGGTATFADSSTMPIASGSLSCASGGPICINAAGVPTFAGSSAGFFLGGDYIFPSTPSTTYFRKRGQTFTMSGVTGTGAINFNSKTFILLQENLNLNPAPSGQYVYMFYREIPVLNATGGTATILPDFNYRNGINGHAALNDLNPQWAHGSMQIALQTGASGGRVYKIMRGVNGYSDQLGMTGSTGSLTAFSTTVVSTQEYMNQHFENGHSRGTFEGIDYGGLLAQRLSKFLFQPNLNAPHSGFAWVPCSARGGSAGNLVFCFNASDGPQPITMTLTPYLQGGQKIIRYVVNDHSITLSTINAGTASDTIILQATDAVFYVFPVTFAIELIQPSISVRLADVAIAIGVAIRSAYSPYYLDVAGTVTDCGSAFPCTVNIDPAIGNAGQHPYRIIYYDGSSKVLAISDVQYQ